MLENLPEDQELHNMIVNEAQQPQNEAKANKPQVVRQSMADAHLNLLDQSIKMLCDTHKAPAVFFSNKEERYVCFKCLVASEKLLYID